MARVKICPVCNRRNEEEADQCAGCDYFLLGVTAEEEADTAVGDAPPANPAAGPWQSPPGLPTLALEFPWGEEVIAGETLLGVDNLRFGARIDGAPNGEYVSGAHAMVSCRDNRFFIRHLSTTNATLLDDEEVEQEAELRDGQKLSLSRRFHLMVRIR